MSLKANLSETFSGLRDVIGRARLSVVEIVFLAAALFFAGFVAFFYFTKVQPLDSELAAREQQIRDLKAQIATIGRNLDKIKIQADNAAKILESLQSFESYLKPDERGMTQIINEIDALGATHKIAIGGADYRVEEAEEPLLDENGNPKPQAASKDKKSKIYPNLGIDTEVVGDYSNLRRFLSDLERSKQFLIINAVAFQGGDDQLVRQLAKGGKQIQLSGPEAIPVSLKIELDTYFKPPVAAGGTATSSEATPKPPVTSKTPAANAANTAGAAKSAP